MSLFGMVFGSRGMGTTIPLEEKKHRKLKFSPRTANSHGLLPQLKNLRKMEKFLSRAARHANHIISARSRG